MRQTRPQPKSVGQIACLSVSGWGTLRAEDVHTGLLQDNASRAQPSARGIATYAFESRDVRVSWRRQLMRDFRCRWRELKARAANGKTEEDAHRPKGGGVPRRTKLEPDRRLSGIDAAITGLCRICGVIARPDHAQRRTELLPLRIGTAQIADGVPRRNEYAPDLADCYTK